MIQVTHQQSVPNTTSPMPLSSKNWFGLVNIAQNLNQIEKILLKYCSGEFVKKVFGTDCTRMGLTNQSFDCHNLTREIGVYRQGSKIWLTTGHQRSFLTNYILGTAENCLMWKEHDILHEKRHSFTSSDRNEIENKFNVKNCYLFI